MRAPSVPDLRLGDRGRAVALPVLLAAGPFALAYANGGFTVATRSVAAIAVWWLIGLALVFRVWPLARPPGIAVVVGSLLAAYAALVLASATWADSAEGAFVEANRATLLLGAFVVGVAASRRSSGAAWADAFALATSAVALVALASRCFPDLFDDRGLAVFLPAWQERLSFPLGYWNGLAIFVALGVPSLLRRAAAPGPPVARAAAVAALPPVAAVAFLAASRGGFATAVVGALAYLALTARRWAVAGALAAGGTGALLALLMLQQRDELVNGPLAAGAVAGQGRSAAVLLLAIAAAVGAVYAALARVLDRRRVPRRVGVAAVTVTALVVVGLAVAADPVERFDEFRQPPVLSSEPRPDFVQSHVTSARGNGRWQFWGASFRQGAEHRLAGEGAGSFAAWWAQNRTIPVFVRDAHSLYLETFGELGIAGLLLVLAFLATALVEGARRTRQTVGEVREVTAALTGLGVAFALAAAVDWVWDLSAVAVLAVLALGVLIGPATAPTELRPRPPAALGVAVVVVAWLVIVGQGVSFLTALQLERSAAAVENGNAAKALGHAGSAQAIQPWAASPYVQQALVEERLGELGRARRSIGEAIERDRRDWRLWLVRARLETLDGDIPAARRSLARLRTLNPRSTIIASLEG